MPMRKKQQRRETCLILQFPSIHWSCDLLVPGYILPFLLHGSLKIRTSSSYSSEDHHHAKGMDVGKPPQSRRNASNAIHAAQTATGWRLHDVPYAMYLNADTSFYLHPQRDIMAGLSSFTYVRKRRFQESHPSRLESSDLLAWHPSLSDAAAGQ